MMRSMPKERQPFAAVVVETLAQFLQGHIVYDAVPPLLSVVISHQAYTERAGCCDGLIQNQPLTAVGSRSSTSRQLAPTANGGAGGFGGLGGGGGGGDGGDGGGDGLGGGDGGCGGGGGGGGRGGGGLGLGGGGGKNAKTAA
jgi:hypothetical protein